MSRLRRVRPVLRSNRFGARALGLVATAILVFAVAPVELSALSGETSPAGTIWTKLGISLWSAEEQFAGPFGQGELTFDGGREIGDTIPISVDEGGGTFRNRSLSIDLLVVPIDRLEVGVHFPVSQRSELELSTTRTTTSGTGDLFTYIGWRLTPSGQRFASKIRGHVKIPTTETSFESLTVPLSEGQVDIAVEQVSSYSLHPQLQLSGRILYRHRFPVTQRTGGVDVEIKPGNETEIGVELGGGPTPWLWLQGGYDALFAQTSEDQTVEDSVQPRERRQVQRAVAGAYFQLGHWLPKPARGLAIDVWARYPFAGIDYLKGVSYGVGLAYSIDAW